MIEIILAAVFSLSATAIFYDATHNKIGQIPGESGLFNLHAGGWAIAALLLWIVAVPAYLFKRASLLRKAAEHPVETARIDFKLALLVLAGIVMFFFNLAALTPAAGTAQSDTASVNTPTPPAAVQEAIAPAPSAPTLGLSKDQILAGLDGFLPALQSSPLGKNKDRLMGQTDKTKALTIVELIGEDATHPYRVSLFMLMPKDDPALVLGNMSVYGAITKNIFPEWAGSDRLGWLTESVQQLQETKTEEGSPAPALEKILEDKVIRISLVKAMGAITITIEHTAAPQ